MKPLLLSFLLFISISLHAQLATNTDTATVAQVINVPKSIHETISTDNISVTYGRPNKTGYTVFGNLKKFGKVWAVGTGKATTVTFSRNVSFAGKNVAVGTYTLFVIPYESEWTIILNTQLEQWGTSTYEKYKDRNIVTVNVPVVPLLNAIDQLTIRFPLPISMIIEWDKAQVAIPIL